MSRFTSPYQSSLPKRSKSILSDLSVNSDVSTQSFSIPGIRGPPSSLFSRLSSIRKQERPTEVPSSSPIRSSTPASSSVQDVQTSTNMLSNPEKPWICAISEGKSTGKELGIAMRNIETGHCFLSQFADTSMYGHLQHMLDTRPCSVVLLPSSQQAKKHFSIQTQMKEDPLRKMLKQSHDFFVADVPRRDFDQNLGLQHLDRLVSVASIDGQSSSARETVFPSVVTLAAVSQKYYALSAFSALVSYIEGSLSQHLEPHTVFIQYVPPEGTVLIDFHTAKDLELVRNAVNNKQMGSLMGILNFCSTRMGERLLRMNILQPLSDPNTVEFRLEAVQQLSLNAEHFYDLRQSLKPFSTNKIDFDKIIAQMLIPSKETVKGEARAVENMIKIIIQLWSSLMCFKGVHRLLHEMNIDAVLLQTIAPILSNQHLDTIIAKIEECIEMAVLNGTAKSNVASKNARLLSIKTGSNSVLDAARRTYTENTADALNLCNELKEKYQLPLKPVFLNGVSTGYGLEMASGNIKLQNLPREFITVSKKRNGKVISMTTVDLKKINQRIQDSSTEIFLISRDIVECLRLEILREVGNLYLASEAIALADVILSLTQYTKSGNNVRPSFGEKISITEGRHPLLSDSEAEGTVPNDTDLGQDKTFVLLNGPNNSGKTTYLKQVALLTIMAHVGCFVPAAYASILPVKQIFSRLSNRDEAEANLSTFASEMKTMAQIIESAGPESLVLIDELGRNTSTHEGIGMAHAISEVLICNRVPTIFATHFVQLNATLSPYPAVRVQQFSIEVNTSQAGDNLIFQHKLSAEGYECQHYGIALAKMCQLPQDILRDAEEIAKRLQKSQSTKEDEGENRTNEMMKRKDIISKVCHWFTYF
ncbi:uncharacterized protein FA14DRAFT_22472 [Meira miltonrushii]|uniref:DNA mismatch repair protein MSH3 n=1 Tax=Meira miltonrushii TaxID=1280837 RepID=A0A316VKJ4_9BASI|nr:uncharacterized protein FA14DRAFT_22472 [Meira miltonrushii]PWN38050.1 hypothetical protein FA14DRAFT_22472 [Meira miltonrushii]